MVSDSPPESGCNWMLNIGAGVVVPETDSSIDDEVTQGQQEGNVPEKTESLEVKLVF